MYYVQAIITIEKSCQLTKFACRCGKLTKFIPT